MLISFCTYIKNHFMKKKLLVILTGFCIIAIFSSQTFFSSQAPSGYTGEFGNTCTGCHNSFAINSGGGGVVVNGLPSGSYTAGQSYPVSVTISHGASNRTRWGFALAARNSFGETVGTFTSTNANAALIGDAEIGHQAAVITPASATYTYSNFRWVAPANPTPNDFNLNFYVVGNAANNNSSSSGDYIYSSVANRTYTTIPVVLSRFTASMGNNFTVQLQWETAQEQNSDVFVIERSADGQNFTAIDRVPAAGNSILPRRYQYTDKAPPVTANARTLYRLKQLDKDGRSAYSALVAVQLKAPATFMEPPVPGIVSKGATVTTRLIAAEAMALQVVVTDAAGKKVYTARQQAVAGANTIILSTAFARSSGIYYVTVQSGGFRQTERILVQ
jgi:Reeler domain